MRDDNIFAPRDFVDYVLNRLADGTFDDECYCRMSGYIAQDSRCYVTGRILPEKEREMHHRTRQFYGGKHTAENTIILYIRVHHLVHAAARWKINSLLAELNLTEQQLHMVNQLRFEAHMSIIKQNSAQKAA